MKSICIQVGHWQIENITAKNLRSWRSAETLSHSTGASGERDYHWNKVMPALKKLLVDRGIQVYVAGGIWDDIYKDHNFDLWLSMHYDGGGSENRCMISAPTREAVPAFLNEKAQREAERFCALWKSIYPEITGTVNRDNRITEGMLWYYAFDYVPLDTPAVIIEHFNHTSTKGEELKTKPELIAQADYQAILKFLDVPETEPTGKYEVTFKGEKMGELDYDPIKKISELEGNFTDKQKEIEKLTKEFEAYKVAKTKEISDLNISHINYKTANEIVISKKDTEIENLKIEISGQKEIIKQLKTNPTFDLYTGWDLIGLGITKLFEKKGVRKNE